MRINSIQKNIIFERRFTKREEKRVNKLHPQVQTILNHTGHNILIIHDPCLPAAPGQDTGIGYLFSKEGLKYLKEMKSLIGITMVEVHPQGEYRISSKNGFCCPYSGAALSLGSHLIPPIELTKKEFGNLLTIDEVLSIAKANTAANKTEILNWENVLKSNSQNEKILKNAFQRFKHLPQNSTLKKEFSIFVTANNDWLNPHAIYQNLLSKYNKSLKHWSYIDKNLYNSDFVSEEKNKRLAELFEKNKDDIEFYKFKQFLADKFLNKSKTELKKIGLTLTGDMLIGFSEAERFAYPKAFMEGKDIGWGLPALDYNTILDANSPAAKLLKRKTELFAQRYDGAIRFDVAWAYLNPAIRDIKTKDIEHRQLKTDALLKLIEDTVKKVCGEKFNEKNLLYEFEAASEDFPLDNINRSFIQRRMKVYSMQYMGHDWGHLSAFINHQLFSPEFLISGLGNQDVLPLRKFAALEAINFETLSKSEIIKLLNKTFGGDINILKSDTNLYNEHISKYKELYNKKLAQAEILSSKYNIPLETLLTNPSEFAKAKAAESFAGQNTMFYFMDVLGSNKVFDSHDLNWYENYRYRIPADYMERYNQALNNGFGINIFDIYERRFKYLGLDKKYPEIFKEIQKYKDIIISNEPKKNPIKKYLAIASCGAFLAGLGLLYLINFQKQKTTGKELPVK